MSKRYSKARFTNRHGRKRPAGRPRQAIGNDAGTVEPRLQKVLAAAGLGSRRDCEQLIVEGRVEVDRRVVTELGTRVDPLHHEIRVDGEPLPRPRRQYFLVNKPPGVVSTARDPEGRPRLIDLIQSNQRLFPVGRLDMSSEGLIIVTNDGELANLLAHPRYEVEKTYLALVAGAPSREVLAKLERGVHLAEGFAHAKRARIKSRHKHSAILEVVLDEGRNREVRRLLARAGHKVLRLKRIALGSLRLGDLAPGEYRPLRADEVSELKAGALAALRREKHRPHKRRSDESSLKAERDSTHADDEPHAVEHESDLLSEDEALLDEIAESPSHTGTIIGGEDVWQQADESTSQITTDSEHLSSPRVSSIKPLIDVRRGIFPGRRDEDDDDLDEGHSQAASAAKQPPVESRPRRDTPKGRSRRAQARDKTGDRQQKKDPRGRRKRRGHSQAQPRGSKPTDRSRNRGAADQAAKRPHRRKGRRR